MAGYIAGFYVCRSRPLSSQEYPIPHEPILYIYILVHNSIRLHLFRFLAGEVKSAHSHDDYLWVSHTAYAAIRAEYFPSNRTGDLRRMVLLVPDTWQDKIQI